MRVIWWEEACHEGEDGNIAFVADVNAFFIVVDGGVTVGLVLSGPVQIIQIFENGGFVALKLGGIVFFGDGEGGSSK